MKTIWLYFLAFGGVCAVALCASTGARPATDAPRTSSPFYTLQPSDVALIRNPFASRETQQRLAAALEARVTHRRLTNLLPADAGTPSPGMGWRIPDSEYWRRIPAEARDLPADWSRLPVVRFTNTQLGGVREARLQRTKTVDLWLLRDPLHELTACISIERATRRVYFMEVVRKQGAWRFSSRPR